MCLKGLVASASTHGQVVVVAEAELTLTLGAYRRFAAGNAEPLWR
jgi:hypothetical protein